MAFPTGATLLDNFNRADVGPPPSASWTTGIFGTASGLKVSSNTLIANTTLGTAYWNANDFGPDCECYVTAQTSGTSFIFLLDIRLTSIGAGATNGYAVKFNNTAGFGAIFKFAAGASTQIGPSFPHSTNVGDSFGFQGIGGNLRAFYRANGSTVWSQIGNAVDTTFTGAGKIGIHIDPASSALDDFYAGNYVAPTGGTAATAWHKG